MRNLYAIWDRADVRLTHWLVRHSVALLRIALGGVFLGFGLLKFLPGLSPAEDLAVRTMGVLTFGLVPVSAARVLLAVLECTIGLCFVTGKFLLIGVWILGLQLLGALSPLLLFTGEMFSGTHHAPSLEGQYVIKDVVLASAGLVLAATLRGGRLVTGPKGMPRDTQAIPRQIPVDGMPRAVSANRDRIARRRNRLRADGGKPGRKATHA